MSDSAAKKAWVAAHTTRIVMNLNHHTDADILQALSAVQSMQGYIKSLIREDIRRSAGETGKAASSESAFQLPSLSPGQRNVQAEASPAIPEQGGEGNPRA